jgi:hypothetical protein
LALNLFISEENGMVFEIHLGADSVAADICSYAEYSTECEAMIAAYTVFRVDEVVTFHIRDDFPDFKWDIDIPRVKLSYVGSWYDFPLEC